jgi:ABC-type transport system involved in multi-copper enzyme maturation permease subunit
MTGLMSAELFRLRTVRTPALIALGIIALAAFMGASTGKGRGPESVGDSIRSVTVSVVLFVALFAAQHVGADFKRGEVALTYLTHPNRWRATIARTLTHAITGGLVALVGAGIAIAAGLAAAHSRGLTADLGAMEIAGAIAGAALAGAAFASAAVLVATITRNPTVAALTLVVPSIVEGILQIDAAHPYFPFGLTAQVVGLSHAVTVPTAIAVLLAYPAACALVVHRWALDRDIT